MMEARSLPSLHMQKNPESGDVVQVGFKDLDGLRFGMQDSNMPKCLKPKRVVPLIIPYGRSKEPS